MKKITTAVLALALISWGTCAFAGDMNDPHYQEIKKLKEKQRAEREANKKNSPPADKNGFWQKEGERSGLGGTGSSIGNFLSNLNPAPFFKDQQEKYNARKAAAVTK